MLSCLWVNSFFFCCLYRFGDVKKVYDRYCPFTDGLGSLMVLVHWWSWVTDVIGSLMVLGHWCYWVTDGLGSLMLLGHWWSWVQNPRGQGGWPEVTCALAGYLVGIGKGGGVKVIFRPEWLRGKGRCGIEFKIARDIKRLHNPWLNMYWSSEFYLVQFIFTCIELQTAYI